MIIFANVAESFAPLTFVSIYGYGWPCIEKSLELKMLEMIKRCYFLARKKSLASLNFVLIYGYDRPR